MLQNPEIPHPAPKPKYPVPVTKDNILRIFGGAADFTLRELIVGRKAQRIWVCSIDGLVSSSEISDFVMKPLMRAAEPVTLESAKTLIYNAVESPVPDMDAAAEKLNAAIAAALKEAEGGSSSSGSGSSSSGSSSSGSSSSGSGSASTSGAEASSSATTAAANRAPNTGDPSHRAVWAVLLALCALGCVLLLRRRAQRP